jgi:tetratricopeptide (TPR) repeat protein
MRRPASAEVEAHSTQRTAHSKDLERRLDVGHAPAFAVRCVLCAVRFIRKWLWILAVAGAAILAPRWWRLVTHPIVVPATPAAAAREELPRLIARVRAEPRSVDARMELMACQALLGDRLAAWQQLALAERLAASAGTAAGVSALATIEVARARTAEALGQLEDAADAAERAWQTSPSDLSRALEAYRLRTLRGEFERALAIIRAAVSHQPTHPVALAAVGEACFNLAHYSEAIHYLEAARVAAPGEPSTAVQLGVALLRADRGREAANVLGEVARSASPPPQAWEFLGQAQLSVGHTQEAGESFRRAEESGAAGGGAAFGAGLVALAQGQPEAAAAVLRRALARDPEHDAAALTLAQLLRSRGRPAEAAAVQGRHALAVGDTADAVARFREAIGKGTGQSPLLPSYWRELARALQSEEDGPGALDALRRAQALAPHDAGIIRQEVETALAVFSPQEALRACRRYAAMRPADSAKTEWWQFRVYRQLQDAPRAAAALRAAAAAQPDQPEFLHWQAQMLLEQAPDAAQIVMAENSLRQALARRPNDVQILASLAEVCIRQNRWEEASTHLRRALSLDEMWGRGRLWLQLAQADRALGQALEAGWDVERYRTLEDARSALARRGADARVHPGDGTRLVAWSRSALRANNVAVARSVARAAVRVAPADPTAYLALATACQRLGRLEDRIVAMEAAAAHAPGTGRHAE